MMKSESQIKGVSPISLENAKQMVELAEIKEGQRILVSWEGTDDLLKAILAQGTCGYNVGENLCSKPGKPGRELKDCRCCDTGTLQARRSRLDIVVVENNAELKSVIAGIAPFATIITEDFLSCTSDLGKFDRIVMTPPLETSIEHIKHALIFLAPGGRLIALCSNDPQAFFNQADLWKSRTSKMFKTTGDMRLVLIEKTFRGDGR